MRLAIFSPSRSIAMSMWAAISPRGRSSLLRNIGGAAGVYRTPALFAEIRGVFTHSVQTSAYRGAGRPEATYAIERTIDLAGARARLRPLRAAHAQSGPAGGNAVPHRPRLHL